MKKASILFALLVTASFPGSLRAISGNEIQDFKEISAVWVDQHNSKLTNDVPKYVKEIRVKPHVYFIASRHLHIVPMKRVKMSLAAKYGIPFTVKTPAGQKVPLVALRLTSAEGQSFLTADYADDLDHRHASSDIYMKIGLHYSHLFHGEGYFGAARVITLGQGSPTFFEVGTFGGGSRCDKTLYRLDSDAVKGISDELYDHPELIDVQKYVKAELKLNVWLEGFTLYRDLYKDGMLEIINSTQVTFPDDLKTKVKERYKLVDNDFAGPFRKTTSIYKWNATKSQFEDLGDYYY